MVEQVTFQMIFQFLQTVGILVGVFYYIMTIRANQRNQQLQLETRLAQLFMQLYQQFISADFVKQMNDLRFRWSFSEDEDFIELFSSAEHSDEIDRMFSTVYFFEGLGVLLKKGLIDAEFIDDLMSSQVISIWERFRPFLNKLRETLGPAAGEWYEYLYEEIKRIYIEQHPELKT